MERVSGALRSVPIFAERLAVNIGNVLFNGFEFRVAHKDKDEKKMGLSLKSFLPTSQWTEEDNYHLFGGQAGAATGLVRRSY